MPSMTPPHPEERPPFETPPGGGSSGLGGASPRTQDWNAASVAHRLRRAMDGLYCGCAAIAGSALVIISLVVPWGVYTRYVLDSAASWPEPMAILLSIVLTFFGAAACYRSGTHMRV